MDVIITWFLIWLFVDIIIVPLFTFLMLGVLKVIQVILEAYERRNH